MIQSETHNSVEDSVAVMDLVRWRIAHPDEIPITPKPFLDVLAIHKRKSVWVDSPIHFEKYKATKGAKVRTIDAGILGWLSLFVYSCFVTYSLLSLFSFLSFFL